MPACSLHGSGSHALALARMSPFPDVARIPTTPLRNGSHAAKRHFLRVWRPHDVHSVTLISDHELEPMAIGLDERAGVGSAVAAAE
jgi:hypothetical protein